MKRTLATLFAVSLAAPGIALAQGYPQGSGPYGYTTPQVPQPINQQTVTGRVQSFTRTSQGQLNGFVLDSGQTVHFPASAGIEITALVPIGAQVRIVGQPVTFGNGRTVFRAQSIANLANGNNVNLIVIPRACSGMMPGGRMMSPSQQLEE